MTDHHDEMRVAPDPSRAEELRRRLHGRLARGSRDEPGVPTQDALVPMPSADADPDDREGDLIMLETEHRPAGDPPAVPRRRSPNTWLMVAAAAAVVAVVGTLLVAIRGDDEHIDTITPVPRTTADPMATVERMIDAVNARDADAFVDVFAPDGRFYARGALTIEAQPEGNHPISAYADRVGTWMAFQDAWGFEAHVRSCTSDPSDPLREGNTSDHWIECVISARWAKLSLEITDRWRFELRGAELVTWRPELLDLDPAERDLALGYPGLEAWEAWLAAKHPEDAARWIGARQEPPVSDFADADDPEHAAALARLSLRIEQFWSIDGGEFSPAGLIPYDPAFADGIETSIHEYLEEQ